MAETRWGQCPEVSPAGERCRLQHGHGGPHQAAPSPSISRSTETAKSTWVGARACAVWPTFRGPPRSAPFTSCSRLSYVRSPTLMPVHPLTQPLYHFPNTIGPLVELTGQREHLFVGQWVATCRVYLTTMTVLVR